MTINIPEKLRGALYLTPTGYKLIPHEDRVDWSTFLAALTLYRWRATWNLL